MVFDVQTYRRALATANELAYGQPIGNVKAEDYANHLREKSCSILCRHLTSSLVHCSDILAQGLAGWSSVLSSDSLLARVFKALGINYEDEVGLVRYGQPFEQCSYEDPSRALLLDDCVNAYLYCGGTAEDYSKSPEILRTLRYRAFPNDANIIKAEKLWREKAAAYCVSFDVQVSDVDVITGYYSTEDDNDIYSALACVLVDVLDAGSSGRLQMTYRPIILKHGVVIPPQDLQVNELCEVDWDWNC